MNPPRRGYRVFSFLMGVLIIPTTARPQGTLAPPSPPAPSMKSLDQIASTGIPINSVNTPGNSSASFVISSSGTYFLASNFTGVSGKNGILINSRNVTIDLNGFQLQGVTGSLTGITDGGASRNNVRIRNGSLFSWDGVGIDLSHSSNSLVSDLIVSTSGGAGFLLGDVANVRVCVGRNNTGDGFATGSSANISHCSAVASSVGFGFNLGPDGTLNDCVANSNGSGGVLAATDCTITATTAGENLGTGIQTGTGSSVISCNGYGNTGSGISVGAGNIVTNCSVSQNISDGGSALFAGSGCTLTNCTAYQNTVSFGITVNPGGTATHCSASYNTSSRQTSGGILLAEAGARDCTAILNSTSNANPVFSSGMGIYCNGADATIENCTCAANSGDGINVVRNCVVRGNLCSENLFSGIHTTGVSNRIERNQVNTNLVGILVDLTNSFVVGNAATQNATNYVIASGNRVSTIVSPTTNGAINGNTGGTTFGSDTSANFAY